MSVNSSHSRTAGQRSTPLAAGGVWAVLPAGDVAGSTGRHPTAAQPEQPP